MSRYIDADALLEKVQFRVRINDDTDKTIKRCVEITRNLIENAPTADVAPVVHAIWKNCGEGDGDWYCTNCKQCQTFDKFGDLHPKDDYGYYYCPNCGAKMGCDNEQE